MGIKKNLISNFILTGSNLLFPLIIFTYVTRVLTNTDLGKIFYIDAFTQYFIILSSLGIPYYGVREIAKIKHDKNAVLKLVLELITLQTFLAIIFSLCLLFLYPHIKDLKSESFLVYTSCLIIISTSFSIEYYYQATENFSYIMKRSISVKLISLAGILFTINKTSDYKLYYLITGLVVFSNSIINFSYFIKANFNKSINRLHLINHLKPLLVLFSINISISIYTILDTIILGLFTNTIEVSYYSVPLKLVKMFWLLVSALGVVLIPKVTSYFNQNNKQAISSILEKSLNITFLLTIPFSMFCLIYPKEILTVFFGVKYIAAINSLRVLSLLPLCIGVCNVMGTQYLLPIGKERKILHATVIGLIVSLTLNFILVPTFSFIGSSVSALITELVVCIYIIINASKNIKLNIDLKIIYLITTSLITAVILSMLLADSLKEVYLLILVGTFYLVSLVFYQLYVFRCPFIYSLLMLKKNEN
jgi:O-antigen/teichoic acid export membrane protein